MRKKGLVVIAVITIALMAVSAWAVPLVINYQGMLTDDVGTPLDGSYSVEFYIYDAPSDGTSLWNESQTVAVTDGIYNVQLGTMTPLTASVFSEDDLYLEVIVETEIMSPRQQISSVAYAIRSHIADGVSAGAIDTTMIGDAAVASNNIQDGAVLDEILDNDGMTSGLDADLLDGQDSSAFSLDGHAHSLLPHDHNDLYYTEAGIIAVLDGSDLASLVSSLETRVAQLEAILAGVSRNGSELTLSGMNVNINNATGTTDGAVNGLGNLTVGYNELRGSGDDRSGSHNIVAGNLQNYSSFGGLVAGSTNTLSGPFASVSGGEGNTASGSISSVSGGYNRSVSSIYNWRAGSLFEAL